MLMFRSAPQVFIEKMEKKHAHLVFKLKGLKGCCLLNEFFITWELEYATMFNEESAQHDAVQNSLSVRKSEVQQSAGRHTPEDSLVRKGFSHQNLS